MAAPFSVKEAAAQADNDEVERTRYQGEAGFTLIELLVVVLIIGILAAVAVTALLSQSHKAYDASAKELVKSAQVAVETIAVDHDGDYSMGSTSYITPEAIHAVEPTIPIGPAQADGGAWLESATPLEEGHGYELVAIAPKTEGERFKLIRRANGEEERLCAPANPVFGCATSW